MTIAEARATGVAALSSPRLTADQRAAVARRMARLERLRDGLDDPAILRVALDIERVTRAASRSGPRGVEGTRTTVARLLRLTPAEDEALAAVAGSEPLSRVVGRLAAEERKRAARRTG